MSGIKWTQFSVVAIIFLLVGAFGANLFFSDKGKYTEEEFQNLSATIAEKDAEITRLNDLNITGESCETDTTKTKCTEYVEENGILVPITGYLVDGLSLNEKVTDDFSDRELLLFDGEVDFSSKDYDAEEILSLQNIEIRANDNDFEGDVYLIVPENGLTYTFVFENGLDTSLIKEDDDNVVFNFLGESVEVSEWDSNRVTFTVGESQFLEEDEEIDFEGNNVTLTFVLEDAVYVTVNGDSRKIFEGDVRTVGGLDVKVEEVLQFNSDTRINRASLVLGNDIENTVSDGDEYEEDSIWEWVINENSIGIRLAEELVELDEEYNALSEGEELCLPNEYLCLKYNGLAENEYEKYNFELDTKDGGDYVRVSGNFLDGVTDYSRIYIDVNRILDVTDVLIYDRDLNLLGLTIELGDTESILDAGLNLVTIRDFEVSYALDSTNILGSPNYDYVTEYGINIRNIENAIEDFYFEISVPEEQVEGSFTLYNGGLEELESDTVDTSANETST